ncbi:MAG: acyl-CoA dehydrogenase C-terminal domain-containing protein, partial [Formosimonas sp.]
AHDLLGGHDDAFLNAKIGTADFYVQQLLPQADALARAVLLGGESVANFDVAGF